MQFVVDPSSLERQLDEEKEPVQGQQRGQHGERRAQLHQPSRFGDDADGAEHADYYRTQFAPQEAAAAVPADR